MLSERGRIYRPFYLLGWLIICLTACGLKNKPTIAPIPTITQLAQTSTPTIVNNTPTPKIQVPTVNNQDLTPAIKELIFNLNTIAIGDASIVFRNECPELYPGWIDSGQMSALLGDYKQDLRKLDLGNYYFQYDCKQKQYQVVIADKQPDAICSCQP